MPNPRDASASHMYAFWAARTTRALSRIAAFVVELSGLLLCGWNRRRLSKPQRRRAHAGILSSGGALCGAVGADALALHAGSDDLLKKMLRLLTLWVTFTTCDGSPVD